MTHDRSGRHSLARFAGACAGLIFTTTGWAQSVDDGWSWALTIKQLEWQESSTPEALMWDVYGRLGTEKNRLWIRNEGGRHVSGARRDNRLEVLWGHPLDWFGFEFEPLLGVRHDTGTTPTRTYGALGVQFEAPFGIGFEATGYLGDGSREGDDLHSGYRLQAERDWQLTERFALALRAEHELWSEDHVRYSEGHGPSMWSGGLRLRYEVAKGVAPYVGVEWYELIDDTASLAEAAGEIASETRFVAGIRVSF